MSAQLTHQLPATRSSPEEPAHFVQFYEDDRFIVEKISRRTANALKHGCACVLVATAPHLRDIETRLAALEMELGLPRSQGRYVALDAADTLGSSMLDGLPDNIRFNRVIGDVIARAAAHSSSRFVSVFGEMVALLCAANNPSAAVHIEQLWNELARTCRFSLCCAYPLSAFANDLEGDMLLRVCAEHSLAIPAENPL